MFRGYSRLAPLTLLAVLGAAVAAEASTHFSFQIGIGAPVVAPVVVAPPPPPPPYWADAPAPSAYGYVWRPGYYVWTGFRYRWMPGVWVRRGYGPGAWERERWDRDRRDWERRDGERREWERDRRDWYGRD
jgi:hypothetical protein